MAELSALAYAFAEQGQLESASVAAAQALRLDSESVEARGVLSYVRVCMAGKGRPAVQNKVGPMGVSVSQSHQQDRRSRARRTHVKSRRQEIAPTDRPGVERTESWVTLHHSTAQNAELVRRMQALELRQSLLEQSEDSARDAARLRVERAISVSVQTTPTARPFHGLDGDDDQQEEQRGAGRGQDYAVAALQKAESAAEHARDAALLPTEGQDSSDAAARRRMKIDELYSILRDTFAKLTEAVTE